MVRVVCGKSLSEGDEDFEAYNAVRKSPTEKMKGIAKRFMRKLRLQAKHPVFLTGD